MKENKVVIKQIEPKDFNQAIDFAKEGMHLSWYVKNKIALQLYSRYAFYEILLKSTTVLGAYLDDQFVGFLFAEFYGEEVVYNYRSHQLYCRVFSKLMKGFGYENTSNAYDEANDELLENFKKEYPNPDGELTFFAVDPTITGKGIGSALLNELTKRNKGKLIYLFSDSGSTYAFYQHRGFEEAGKKEITIPIDGEENLPLTCFIFSKKL